MWTPPEDEKVQTTTRWQPPPDERIDAVMPQNQSLLDRAVDYVQNKAVDFAADIAGPQRLGEYVGAKLPAAGAVVGGVVAPGPGAALGAGLGQIGQRMIGIATGAQSPAGSAWQEAKGPMLQAGVAGIFDTKPVQSAIQSAAQNLGRRALGFTKPMIDRMKGGVQEANQVAQTMLDENVIRPLSGAEANLGRAKEVAAKSGAAIGQTLAKSGKNALDAQNVAAEVIDQLAPTYRGGAYNAEENIAQEIVDTIQAHGQGPIDFQSAQKLKETLGRMAGNNWSTDKVKADMYQRAYGIVSKAIEDGVENAAQSSAALPTMPPGAKAGEPHALFAYNDDFGLGGTKRAIYNVFGDPTNPAVQKVGWGSSVSRETLQNAGIPIKGAEPRAVGHTPAGTMPSSELKNYQKNKILYGASQKAIEGLTNKVHAEAGRSLFGLRSTIGAVGGIATGDPVRVLESIGVIEGGIRRGAGTGAAALNSLNNNPATQGARQAIFAEFMRRMIKDQP